MTITNVKYVKGLIPANGGDPDPEYAIHATINGIQMSIPKDPDNTQYQEIQEWVAEGNKIEDAD